MATFNVINGRNEVVGTLELSDEVFGGRVKNQLIWESVVHANAKKRRGTHATKTRAHVSGSGKKPWRQKGTGRARVGEIRNPLWRKGGTVFGPQPRSYDYRLPRQVERGGLRAALCRQMQEGALIVIDRLAAEEPKAKIGAELLDRLGVSGKTLLIDVTPDDKFARSVRNIPGIRFLSSGSVTARDVMDARRIIATGNALQHLQEVLRLER